MEYCNMELTKKCLGDIAKLNFEKIDHFSQRNVN
jgi:hypothetical protein